MTDVNILLVEDESIEALDIKHTLESFGYEVPYIASRGEEAVEKAFDIMPDLVLIDIVLKGDFNGIKVASEIKKLNIPFIYLTAHSEEATVHEAKLTEPYGFIIKPYDPLELKYTIDIALYKKSVEKVRDNAEKLRRKTENKLKLASLYNRSLIEASLDPLVTIGPDGKITDVNQATEKVTGYSREKIIGTDFSNYFTQPEQARKGYQKVFEKGFVRDYPLEIQHKDESVTPVLYNASIYKDESGDVVGVFASASDITQLKKVEKKLKKSILYNRSLIEASLDPLVTIGPDGKITDVNQATASITGYFRDELIGTDFSDYFTQPEKAKEGYQQVFKEGYVRDYLLKIRHKNGTITPVLYNASLYRDESGNLAGVFAAARDITQRQKADEKIHEIMENFRAIADNASEGILIAAGEGLHVYANQMAAEITGYSIEELLKTSITDLSHPDKKKGLIERYKKRLAGKNLSPTHETIIVRKDEKVIPVELTGAITVWKGQPADLVIIRDITERKQAEKEQKRLNRNLKAISNCNQTLLRAIDERTLLKEICRIICEEAGYRLAWVGYAENDVTKTIRPVAWAGYDSGYIANTKLSWSDETERGRGPAGIVIRSGEIVYVQDFTTDALMAPWRESALQHGYRSGIALPLKDENRNVFGVLLIYSSKTNAITTDEIWLMEELAGNLAFGITSLRERAELKRVKEELKLASLYNRSLIEASLDPLVTIGPDGKITDVNQATEKVTGYSREKIIGTDFSNYFTQPEKARKGYQKVYKKGFVRDYPLEIQHKNESVTPVLYNASVYKDESGDVVGVFAAARDITERQKSEEKIQMLANVVESSDDAIISKSLEGRITSWNKGAELIYGYSAEEIMGKDISILAPSNLKDEIKKFIEKIKQGERILHYETVRVRKDGEKINVSLTLSPILDNSGDLVGISTIARDITQRKQAEKVLKKTERQLSTLMNNFPDFIARFDREYRHLYVNSAVTKEFGIPLEQFIGKKLHELPPKGPPEQNDILEVGIKKAFEEGITNTCEVIWSTENGDRFFEIRHIPEYDENGRVVSVLGITRDISESKQAEKEILQAKEEWERTFDAVPDLIAILDTNYHVVRANKAMADRLGVSPAEAVGVTCYEVVHGLNEPPSFCPHSRLLEDGHEHAEEVHEDRVGGDFIVSVSPLYDSKGELMGSVHVAHDINERKNMEEKVLEQYSTLKGIIESSESPIFSVDTNYCYTSFNKSHAAVMKALYHADIEIGENLIEYQTVEEGATAKANLNRALNGERFREEVYFGGKGSSGSYFEISHNPIQDANGKVIGVAVYANDITDRKLAEDELKSSLKEKEILLSEIHHRVKNNMQIISSLLNLQTQYVTDSETVEVLHESQDRVKAMATLYEKLSQSDDLTKINFESYIQSLIHGLFYSHRIKEGQITPIIKIENIMLNIETAIPCGLIISELVSNSLKHAFPEGKEGKMCVSIKSYDNKYKMKISDEGIGFPENIDFKNTNTLGLKLVNTLVKQIDGEVSLDRRHGTEYTIIFRELEYEKRI